MGEQLETLKHELSQYREDLPTKPQAIIANKMDLESSQQNLKSFKEKLCNSEFSNLKLLEISGKYGKNLASFLHYIRLQYDIAKIRRKIQTQNGLETCSR